MSNTVIVYGSTVEVSANGSTGWQTVPELTGIAVPSSEATYVDVTNLDSPGGYREYVQGLFDAGQLTLAGNYTHDGFAMMKAYQTSRAVAYFRVTLPPAPDQSTGDVHTYTAFVTVSVGGADVGGKVDMTVNLRITGEPGFTEGAA